MPVNGIIQKQQYIHSLKHDITKAPHSFKPAILHNSNGHQGTIHIFETIRRSYWWPKLGQDIIKYIGICSVYAKHLPNIARYQQKHFHLPAMSKGNRWALTAIC